LRKKTIIIPVLSTASKAILLEYKRILIILIAVTMINYSGLAHESSESTSLVSAVSPDGAVRIEFSLLRLGGTTNVPHYRVMFSDQQVVGYSRLGIELEGGSVLGETCEIETVETRSLHEEYQQVVGKHRNISFYATELLVRLCESAAPQRVWEVALRAFDDGAAFCYRFPKQAGWDTLALVRERTEFRLPAEAKTFALPLNGFTTSYEKRYQVLPVRQLPKTWLLGLPLLFECPAGTWAAVSEANVKEYAGMYLTPVEDGLLLARLSPLPQDSGMAVRAPLPHASPWRVIFLGDHVGRLVESDIILNLSDPCAIRDPSWIQTGKTTFPWWNGYFEEEVSFEPGLNTATAKYYIDFCAEAGIPYHSLDGLGNTAWYGGPIYPYEGADPTKAIEGLDLAEVLNYAKEKNIRIRLWMNWKAAAAFMEKAFPLYQDWGIEGVMLDFMDRDDQEMNRFVRKAVQLAAENQLTVTLHGCPKPTGLERTFPNLLTYEGVMNLEYNKWDQIGITPDHEVTVPFTRMLAGPLDFHQGSFRTVKPEEFRAQKYAPLVMGTPARTLASYVVYQNHLSMVADYPTAYRGHPGLPILAAIPTNWDDTRVLDAKVGEFVIIARRNDKAWYIGAMTDRKARNLKVFLQFLGPGRFTAELWLDDMAASHGLSRREVIVSAMDELILNLQAAGGAYVRLVPVN
jgi:alpha-glucosidase